MGTFNVKIEIGPLDGARYAEVEALVDTGSTTTMIPSSILRGLGITPAMTQTFEYADGRRVDLELGEASVKVNGRETPTWVIFGSDGSGALLGAYTLEGTFLGVDPHNKRLIPVETGLLKVARVAGVSPRPSAANLPFQTLDGIRLG